MAAVELQPDRQVCMRLVRSLHTNGRPLWFDYVDLITQGLTFQNALQSEHVASLKLSKFPETHMEEVLRMIHHGMMSWSRYARQGCECLLMCTYLVCCSRWADGATH